MTELCVDVSGLTKVFGEFRAVDGVDFQIKKGSIFGFLGPNGAGKSTTIRMLLGILKPSSGAGMVLGHDILTESRAIRSRVGYMAQRFSLYTDLTPQENLRFFAGLSGVPAEEQDTRISEVVELVRLRDYVDSRTEEIPGGVRQRLALAVALLHEPELVFLDEPTGNVDPALRRYFWELIVELSERGKTVMVTSHYMDEVERCDRICFIHSGRLLGQGTPRELKEETIPKDILSFRTERRQDALHVLAGVPGVEYPFPAGSTVRFLYEGERETLHEALRTQGFSPETLSPTRPNLEDVFIYLAKEGKL